MTEIEYVIEQVKTALSDISGVDVIDAYPNAGMRTHTVPVICVGLKQGEEVSMGFAEYLGIFHDPESGLTVEAFGKRMTITVSTDIYSPKDDTNGGKKCLEVFAEIAHAAGNFPKSMKAEQILCGQTEYDKNTGMFRCPTQIKLNICLYAQRADEDEILDFKLKGVMK